MLVTGCFGVDLETRPCANLRARKYRPWEVVSVDPGKCPASQSYNAPRAHPGIGYVHGSCMAHNMQHHLDLARFSEGGKMDAFAFHDRRANDYTGLGELNFLTVAALDFSYGIDAVSKTSLGSAPPTSRAATARRALLIHSSFVSALILRELSGRPAATRSLTYSDCSALSSPVFFIPLTHNKPAPMPSGEERESPQGMSSA